MERKVVGGSIYVLTEQMSGFEEDGHITSTMFNKRAISKGGAKYE